MPRLTLLFAALAALAGALAATPALAQGGPTAVLCAGYQQQWDAVKGGTNVAAMQRVIGQINPGCTALLRQARLRLAAVETPRPTPPVRPVVISNPDWSQRPTGDDMANFFPERALRMNVSGHATIECEVTAGGALDACSVVSEDPPDYGFGDAALKLAPLFRMRPMTRDGVPVAGAKVIVPIGFQMPQDN